MSSMQMPWLLTMQMSWLLTMQMSWLQTQRMSWEAPVPVSENIAFCVDETQNFEFCADETSAECQEGVAKSADLLRISAKSSLREQSTDPGFPGYPADQVSWTAGRTPLPHAPGARMTVVTQTPSN